MDQTQTRVQTQRAEDLRRLADQGERNGCRILVEPISGEHFATSATSPILYRVGLAGCTCRGYQAWHRCQHFALYLSECGMLPDLEPDVVVDEHHAPHCRTCRGEGTTRAYIGGGLSDWVVVPCACRAVAHVA